MPNHLKDNKYTQMQQKQYDEDASKLRLQPGSLKRYDPMFEYVVGNYYLQNEYPLYEHLFDRIENTKEMIALDFGCGPGRCILLYKDRFKRIDGVDISDANLDNFLRQIKEEQIDIETNLYKCNGYDLDIIGNNVYDLVLSTITLEHIAVYDIRLNYFKEFYRVLKNNGILTFQMTYGPTNIKHRQSQINYYSNDYTIVGTNGLHDVRIDCPEQLIKDLEKCGFVNIKYQIFDTLQDSKYKNLHTAEKFIFVQTNKIEG